jgi:hypothetical protein
MVTRSKSESLLMTPPLLLSPWPKISVWAAHLIRQGIAHGRGGYSYGGGGPGFRANPFPCGCQDCRCGMAQAVRGDLPTLCVFHRLPGLFEADMGLANVRTPVRICRKTHRSPNHAGAARGSMMEGFQHRTTNAVEPASRAYDNTK